MKIRAAKTAVVVFAFVVVLALVGCTPAAGPRPSGPSSGAPTPTPTATLAAAPVPALPLSCARLFTIGAVQSHLHDAVTVKVDETHPGSSIDDLALLQAGGTECTWGGEHGTDSSWDTELVLQILPAAAAAFAARATPPYGPLVANTIGGGSAYYCPPSGGGWCFGEALAGTSWVHFEVGDANGPDGGPTGSMVEAIMKSIVDAVGSAGGAVAPWARPKAPLDGSALCTAAGAQALLSSALGAAVSRQDAVPGFDGVLGAAAHREGITSCSWSAGADVGIGIEVLPGGSWVYPRVAAAPPLWTLIGRPTAISAPGSDGGALVGCGDHCEGLFSIRGSVVHLNLNDLQDQATATAITQRLVAGIPQS